MLCHGEPEDRALPLLPEFCSCTGAEIDEHIFVWTLLTEEHKKVKVHMFLLDHHILCLMLHCERLFSWGYIT